MKRVLHLLFAINLIIFITFTISCNNTSKYNNFRQSVLDSTISYSPNNHNNTVQVIENNDNSTIITDYYKSVVKDNGSIAFYDLLSGDLILNGPSFNCNYDDYIMYKVSPTNSSFELNEDFYEVADAWKCNKNYLHRSDDYASDGKYSLKFDMTSSDDVICTASSSLIQVKNDKVYEISVDSYYDDYTVGTPYAYIIYYETLDGTGTSNCTLDHLTPPTYIGKWYTNRLTFIPPYGTLSFRLCLLASADSIASLYWDNVVINEITKVYQTNGIVSPSIVISEDNISIISEDNSNFDVDIRHEYRINIHSPNIKYTSTLTYKNDVKVNEERFDFTIPSAKGKILTRDMTLGVCPTNK